MGAAGAVRDDSRAVDSPEALGRVAISGKSYEYEKRTRKCGRRQRGSENHLKYAEEKNRSASESTLKRWLGDSGKLNAGSVCLNIVVPCNSN